MREGLEVRPAKGASPASRQAGTRPHFPPQIATASVSRRTRCLAGAGAPVHVLFFKEVARPSGTPRTKARSEPGLLDECPCHLK